MQLSDEGHSVVIIDKNKDAFRRLIRFNGQSLLGSDSIATSWPKLKRPGRRVAAVTRGDNTNISARALPATTTASRMSSRASTTRNAPIST